MRNSALFTSSASLSGEGTGLLAEETASQVNKPRNSALFTSSASLSGEGGGLLAEETASQVNKPRKRRLPFSLLEIILSTMLAMAIMSATLYFWRWLALSEAKIHKDEELAFALRRLQSRLSEILSDATPIALGENEEEKTIFFLAPTEEGLTRSPSLFFSYYNDSLSPLWRGALLGRLLVDSEKRLMIASWPYSRKKDLEVMPVHLEVLMEGVEGIEFEFLPWREELTFPDIKPGIFTSNWRSEYDTLPIAIKIKLSLPYPHTIAIPIPSCSRHEE